MFLKRIKKFFDGWKAKHRNTINSLKDAALLTGRRQAEGFDGRRRLDPPD
jgi:hypothetical protein